MRKFTLFVALLNLLTCFLSLPARAQIWHPQTPMTGEETNPAFDRQFVIFMRHWRVPGASVTIMRNGKVLLSRGYGWADVQTRQQVLPDSLFRLGSVSKTITAVTILRLMDQGKLSLDDKAFYILDNLSPLSQRRNPQIYQITVRDLLQMTSGWQTNIIDPMFGPWTMTMLSQLNAFNEAVPPNCLAAARLIMGTPLRFKPGTQFSYSNINYCLLGLITNKVTGSSYGYQNYETYVQQNVLAPLGITDMRIGDTLLQNRAPGEVRYYGYNEAIATPQDLVSKLAEADGLPYSNSQILKKNFADGGWIASSQDLAKFLQGIANHQLLSARAIEYMLAKPAYQKRKADHYFALSWTVKQMNGHRYYFKTGSFTGTYAFIMQRDDGTSYATVFNIKPSQRITFVAQLQRILMRVG